MATIELAQQAPQAVANASASTNSNSSLVDTVLAPMPGTATVVPADDDLSDFIRGIRPMSEATTEQKRAIADIKDAEQQAKDASLEQQRQSELLEREEKEELSYRKSLIQRGANGINMARGLVDSAKNGIGNIPIPGGLTFAILVLLILFLLIVQVNGKSRLSWLWLVLTNNAFVDTNPSSPAPSDATAPSNGGSGSGSNVTPIPSGTFGEGNDAGGFGGGASGNFGGPQGFAGNPNVGGASGNFGSASPSISLAGEFF